MYLFRSLGFISRWGALAGRYAALCPPGWPWTHHRMPFHSPTHGKESTFNFITPEFRQMIIIILIDSSQFDTVEYWRHLSEVISQTKATINSAESLF